MRGLQREYYLQKELHFYKGQKKDLNRIRWTIKQNKSTRTYKKLLEQGIKVINKIKISPERFERMKAEAEEIIKEVEISREIVSKPLRSSKMDGIEEKAEELIAERSLPVSNNSVEGLEEEKEKQKTDEMINNSEKDDLSKKIEEDFDGKS